MTYWTERKKCDLQNYMNKIHVRPLLIEDSITQVKETNLIYLVDGGPCFILRR